MWRFPVDGVSPPRDRIAARVPFPLPLGNTSQEAGTRGLSKRNTDERKAVYSRETTMMRVPPVNADVTMNVT